MLPEIDAVAEPIPFIFARPPIFDGRFSQQQPACVCLRATVVTNDDASEAFHFHTSSRCQKKAVILQDMGAIGEPAGRLR